MSYSTHTIHKLEADLDIARREIDRLKAENAELLAALEAIVDSVDPGKNFEDVYFLSHRVQASRECRQARAAIAKAKGE